MGYPMGEGGIQRDVMRGNRQRSIRDQDNVECDDAVLGRDGRGPDCWNKQRTVLLERSAGGTNDKIQKMPVLRVQVSQLF